MFSTDVRSMHPAPSFDPSEAAWLAHRYDSASDRIMYRHVPREMHAAGPFLTDELVGERPDAYLSRAEALAAARGNAAPTHFIFHSAFCASTLLARALDKPGMAMGLSEPVLLNDVVGLHRRGERKGADLARLLDDSLTLLSRRWEAGEAVIVKPSNILTGLYTPILTLRAESRAVLLYAPLREFLTSVARKGLWCRLWVRELLEGLLRERLVDLGFEGADYFRLSDLQVAAVSWLTQHRQFSMLNAKFPDRTTWIDSGTLLSDSGSTMSSITALFSLHNSGDLSDSPAFHRHSKTGEGFSADARTREQAEAIAAHRDEIDKVHDWAVAVAENADIQLPAY